MLSFGISIVAWVLATVVPAFAGVGLAVYFGRVAGSRYSAFFGLGVVLWVFLDTIQGSSDLLVNEGFSGGGRQLFMVGLFVIGVIGFIVLNWKLTSKEGGSSQPNLGVLLLVAVALGVHGLGEGSDFGKMAALTSSTDLLQTFGGAYAGAAYALHKLIEPMMIGIVYVGLMGEGRAGVGRASRDIGLLGTLFALPSILGAAVEFFVQFDATYFYGLGAGASVVVLMALSRQANTGGTGTIRESLASGAALCAGFLLIYAAALLHA